MTEDTSKETKVAEVVPVSPAQTMIDLVGTKGQNIKVFSAGEVVAGTILSKGRNEVYLDIPGYGVGVVRGRELYDDQRVLSGMKVGDAVDALIVDPENKDGLVELSFRKAGHERVWNTLQELMEKEEVVETKILEANKGGLMVEINNVVGFLPVSQLATEHYPRVEEADKNRILSRLQEYVGQTFRVRVITADPDEEKLIVSEKAAQEEAFKKKLQEIEIGKTVEGTVTGVVDFGIFVKFDGELEGLVHISELAWQRIDNPKDLYKVGDKIKAQIISLDKNRISLSIKRLQKDPWQDVVKKYEVGQKVKGKVTKLMPFGAFVELDDDIHGLAHAGELVSGTAPDAKSEVKEGEEYEFKIISIEPENHRLGLSIKALTAPPEEKLAEKKENVEEAKAEEKTEEKAE